MSDGPRTSSIRRPRSASRIKRAAPSKSPRRSDFTRPIPIEARIAQRPRSRLVLGTFGFLIVAAIAAALFVLPVKAWLTQRDELAERKAELAALELANTTLQRDVDRLNTTEGIEDAARDELGYVIPGEERVGIVDAAPLPTALPDGWPYDLVNRILAVRAAPAPAAAP